MNMISSVFAVFFSLCLCSKNEEAQNAKALAELSLEDTQEKILDVEVLYRNELDLSDIRNLLCLDCDLGDKYDQLVYKSFRLFLENENTEYLSSVLVKKFLLLASQEDFKAESLVSYFRRGVSVQFNDDCGLDKDLCAKVSALMMIIFQFSPTHDEDVKIVFDKFSVVVDKSNSGCGEPEKEVQTVESSTPSSIKESFTRTFTEDMFMQGLFSELENSVKGLEKIVLAFRELNKSMSLDRKLVDLYVETLVEKFLGDGFEEYVKEYMGRVETYRKAVIESGLANKFRSLH